MICKAQDLVVGGVRIRADRGLAGSKTAEMYKDDDEVRVSPAMYKLLETDKENVMKTLVVKIVPPKKKIKRRRVK